MRPKVCSIIYPFLTIFNRKQWIELDTYPRGANRVARYRRTGQCEGLYTVERATGTGSTFFVYV